MELGWITWSVTLECVVIASAQPLMSPMIDHLCAVSQGVWGVSA